VPIGTYQVEIKLFSDGALVTHTITAFENRQVSASSNSSPPMRARTVCLRP